MLDEPCCICQDSIKKPILVACCQNIFCSTCILEWLKSKSSCPLCRTDICAKSLILLNNKNDDEKKDIVIIEKKDGKTKQDTIIDILKSKPNGKFIIFSSYDESFKIVGSLLSEHCINFTDVKGDIRSRERKISLYKDGGCNILLLNSTYNGAGINLQATTDIILYHEMNNNIEKQVIGRANRIGRTSTLTVHRLKYSF